MEGGALPNLVIIGAGRCGTTSLHQHLSLHPQVAMSRTKELNVFAAAQADPACPMPRRLIVSLRDPQERAISHYRHAQALGADPRPADRDDAAGAGAAPLPEAFRFLGVDERIHAPAFDRWNVSARLTGRAFASWSV